MLGVLIAYDGDGEATRRQVLGHERMGGDMRVYHVETGHESTDSRDGYPSILLAYEGSGEHVRNEATTHKRSGRRVLLDSGAFGAWRSGQLRDLGKYIDVCKALAPIVDAYASLDVIGDWQGTMTNHERMLRAGLDPMPTFHFGEPPDALDAIMALRPAYIGLGGLVGKSKKARKGWLDPVWARLVREPTWPFKVHGWGMTDFTLVPRYPWFSVDSSSAISASRGGGGVPPAEAGGSSVRTDRTRAGKHGLVRVRQYVEKIEETARFATEKWTAQGIVWKEDQ